MAIHMLDKMQFLKDLKHTENGFSYYEDFFDYQIHQKYSRNDVLELLITQILKQFSSMEMLNLNYCRKLFLSLCAFLEHMNYLLDPLTLEEYKKLEQILQYQEEYQKRFPLEQIGFSLNFSEYGNLLHRFSILKEEANACEYDERDEKLKELQSKISELENQIKKQDRAIKARDTQKEKSLALEQELRRKLRVVSTSLGESQTENAEQKNEISLLKLRIDEILVQNQRLKEQLQKHVDHAMDVNHVRESIKNEFAKQKKKSEATILSLDNEKQQLLENTNFLQNKIELLEHEVWTQRRNILTERRKHRRQELILDILIQELYKHPITVVQAQELLSKSGFSLTNLEVESVFSELKNRFCIQGPIFQTIPPFYKVETSPNLKKSPILINTPNKNFIDVFYEADTHFNPCSDINISSLTNQVNDYCAKNSISYIFHLGDFFSLYAETRKLTIENLKLIQSLFEKVRKNYIICNDFYYGFLGGNHDRHFLPFGINPIEMFIEGKENCFSLGYDYAIVMLKNHKNCIHLHHPSALIRQDEQGNIDAYVEKFYRRSTIKRRDISFDFFGHIHNSHVNLKKGYGLVPSLNHDRMQNGAWHVRFYFDQDENLDYLVIKELKLDKTLELTAEYVYNKKRVKQK